ncbi:MAG: SIR2 family protein [Candidatus Cloacimonetes bacterium]|nr:SIR2 family protein [Candidatus Cloacimonadota bacterium]
MPKTDIKDNIKDIPEVRKPILEAASQGKLVIFIGAGVSRIIGCPSWKNLALKYLKYLYEEKRCINFYEHESLSKLDPRKLLSICRKMLEKEKIPPPDIKSFLNADKELKEKYTIYEDLYKFSAVYVTTNYDDYLDQVAEKPMSEIPSVANSTLLSTIEKEQSKKSEIIIHSQEKLLTSKLDNGKVIHLHGSIKDAGNLIMTIVDYMKHYENGGKPAVFLEEMFNKYTVLFVGYELEEYELLEFIIHKSHSSKNEKKHFMLYPILRQELSLLNFQQEYYKDLGIELVPYPIDENGYEQLAIVIREWANQIGNSARPQNFLDKIKLIDEVVK